jgi:tetratricopeptide (TPR) repeat protein
MSRSRWQHLDLRKAEPRPSASAPILPNSPLPSLNAAGPHPALQPARAYYRLREYDACAQAVRRLLQTEPEAPGANRLLGFCLGAQGEYSAALPYLHDALRQDPDDAVLANALLSAELAAGAAPEVTDPKHGELAGAAAWRRGQRLLEERGFVEAARSFAVAGERFAASSPASSLAERLAACYVGQVIAYLAADQLETAQQCFTRQGRDTPLPQGTLEFAARLYSLAEVTRELSPEERREAFAPLVELIESVRMRVGFVDGTLPVAISWLGLP